MDLVGQSKDTPRFRGGTSGCGVGIRLLPLKNLFFYKFKFLGQKDRYTCNSVRDNFKTFSQKGEEENAKDPSLVSSTHSPTTCYSFIQSSRSSSPSDPSTESTVISSDQA